MAAFLILPYRLPVAEDEDQIIVFEHFFPRVAFESFVLSHFDQLKNVGIFSIGRYRNDQL